MFDTASEFVSSLSKFCLVACSEMAARGREWRVSEFAGSIMFSVHLQTRPERVAWEDDKVFTDAPLFGR